MLEIQRGKGTFVTQAVFEQQSNLGQLSDIKVNAKDLYEMRLIFEPEAAYLAAIRGTDAEIKRILDFGEKIEQEIKSGQDRTDNEHSFHKAIAQATHNEFMNQLMPILYQAIAKGVNPIGYEPKSCYRYSQRPPHDYGFFGAEKCGGSKKCHENSYHARYTGIGNRIVFYLVGLTNV